MAVATQQLVQNGYNGVKAMFGPKFGSATQAVYDAANGSVTENTIVPK